MRLFPVPEQTQVLGPCGWCGAPSVKRMIVEPAIFGSASGVRLLKKRAIEADVCTQHAAMLDREHARQAAAKAAKSAKKPTRRR